MGKARARGGERGGGQVERDADKADDIKNNHAPRLPHHRMHTNTPCTHRW